MSGFPRSALTAPLELPAVTGEPLTTQGGNTLDDGSGNMTVAGAQSVDGSLITSGACVVNGSELQVPNGPIKTNQLTNVSSNGAPGFPYGIATSPPTVTTPAIPASGTAVTNDTGVDVVVYLVGGTPSGATQINGVTTGQDSGTFYLPSGFTITLTYTAAPTWVWMGI